MTENPYEPPTIDESVVSKQNDDGRPKWGVFEWLLDVGGGLSIFKDLFVGIVVLLGFDINQFETNDVRLVFMALFLLGVMFSNLTPGFGRWGILVAIPSVLVSMECMPDPSAHYLLAAIVPFLLCFVGVALGGWWNSRFFAPPDSGSGWRLHFRCVCWQGWLFHGLVFACCSYSALGFVFLRTLTPSPNELSIGMLRHGFIVAYVAMGLMNGVYILIGGVGAFLAMLVRLARRFLSKPDLASEVPIDHVAE